MSQDRCERTERNGLLCSRMRPFQGNLPSCPIAFVGTNASGFIDKRVCQSEIYNLDERGTGEHHYDTLKGRV
jgi:hypothetical protein